MPFIGIFGKSPKRLPGNIFGADSREFFLLLRKEKTMVRIKAHIAVRPELVKACPEHGRKGRN
jgi:hypothetical protein